jgi:hypothetical protein
MLTIYLSLKKNPLIIIVFLLAIILLVIIFLFNKHYPIHDEIITFDRYLRWHTFLRRDAPNNHLLTSLIGTISNSIFSFNFNLLRFFSFISLIGILLIYTKLYKNYYIFLFFYISIISSELIINYSYLFRGYYLSSFISVIIFYYLYKYYFKKNNNKYISISFFLLFLLCIHALYTLYIVIPIIASLFIFSLKEKKFKFFTKKFLIFFLLPTTSVYFLVIIITGFSNEFSGNLNIKYLLNNLTTVVTQSFKPGIIAIFFDENVQVLNPGLKDPSIKINTPEAVSFLSPLSSRLITLKSLYGLINSEPIIFFILFFSFLLAVVKSLLGKFNIYDSIVLIFFIFYFFLNINPFVRVFVSFIYFFIFYIVYNLETIIKYSFLNIIFRNNFLSFLFCTLSLIITLPYININNNYLQELKNKIELINKFKNDCDRANKILDQYHIWILINFYPNRCYYKYDYLKKINIISNTKLSVEYKKKEISSIFFKSK